MPASSKELADTAPGNSTKRAARRSIFGNGARVMGVNWIETALGAIYFAVMARCLGPILYGYWAYGIATYTLLVGLAGFGLDILILLHLGRDKEGAADFVGVTLTLRLGLLGFAAIGLAAYALVAEAEPATRLVLLLLVPALAGRGVALWARTCFLAYERMADYARFAALFRMAEAGCGISYLAAGGGLLGVVVLHSLFWFGEGSFGLWRIRSRLTGFALHLDWRFATDLLAQGAILGLATAAYAWLTTGPIMLLRYGGIAMAQVGQFAIVMSLTMILVGSAGPEPLGAIGRDRDGIWAADSAGHRRRNSRGRGTRLGDRPIGCGMGAWCALRGRWRPAWSVPLDRRAYLAADRLFSASSRIRPKVAGGCGEFGGRVLAGDLARACRYGVGPLRGDHSNSERLACPRRDPDNLGRTARRTRASGGRAYARPAAKERRS
jgi:hypothetical protein